MSITSDSLILTNAFLFDMDQHLDSATPTTRLDFILPYGVWAFITNDSMEGKDSS
jgi:hypothetical protein